MIVIFVGFGHGRGPGFTRVLSLVKIDFLTDAEVVLLLDLVLKVFNEFGAVAEFVLSFLFG